MFSIIFPAAIDAWGHSRGYGLLHALRAGSSAMLDFLPLVARTFREL